MGDSDFVLQILEEANEKFNRYYEMEWLGYDLNTLEKQACNLFELEKDDIYSKSREKVKAELGDCFVIDRFGNLDTD